MTTGETQTVSRGATPRVTNHLTWSWRAWIVGLALIIPPLLYIAPIHRIAGRLTAMGRARTVPPVDVIVAEVDRWQRWLRWPWHTTCLKRAAVLFTLLRRCGINVELHIGVRRNAEKAFGAHAWLVRDGQPYLEAGADALPSFRVIACFPEVAAPTA